MSATCRVVAVGCWSMLVVNGLFVAPLRHFVKKRKRKKHLLDLWWLFSRGFLNKFKNSKIQKMTKPDDEINPPNLRVVVENNYQEMQ